MRATRIVVPCLCALLITVAAGRWGRGLFTTSEFVHFSVNFPTNGDPVTPRQALGGPWARLAASEWQGYPAGGLIAWGREGQIVVDLGRQGWIKELLQPWRFLISTHWLRNVGPRPYRVALEMDLCGMPMTWVTFERDWDAATLTSTRVIEPGARFNMDWIVDVPPDRRVEGVLCDGELRVRDADAGRLLTTLPIRILNSSRQEGSR